MLIKGVSTWMFVYLTKKKLICAFVLTLLSCDVALIGLSKVR